MLCRLNVFGSVPDTRRSKPGLRDVAWQDWHPGARDERRDARLSGAGSFYFGSPRKAWRRARVLMAQFPLISQIKVEGIGSQPVGRLCRSSRGIYGYACDRGAA